MTGYTKDGVVTGTKKALKKRAPQELENGKIIVVIFDKIRGETGTK